MKNFYWNEETLHFFRELKNKNEKEFYEKVNKFVRYECDAYDHFGNENILDLQIDLINQVNNQH